MYNRIKYKSEILASEHLIDIFRLNILQEYDWSLSSLKKEQARTDLTNDLDNELRRINEGQRREGDEKESKELNVTTKDRKRKRIEGNVEENNNRNYEA
ncbi:14869_t:CDS:2 [Rhizophagus irregularis]|nr:14869_t:CDS:2 [Rhizophagus irregularis]